MTERHTTPAVRKTAERHGVDISTVTATGIGGRLTTGDVRAAAGLPRQPVPPNAPTSRPAHVYAGARRGGPLVQAAFAADPARARVAAATAPAPGLFNGGDDLPAFTSSGIDPALLRHVPWQARHPLARARTTADAYSILGDFVDLSPEEADVLAALNYGDDVGNVAYGRRVDQWLVGGMTDAQVYGSLYGTG